MKEVERADARLRDMKAESNRRLEGVHEKMDTLIARYGDGDKEPSQP